MHAALGRDLAEWRPPQVADFARLKGSVRYAPGQTEAQAFADLRVVLDAPERRFPGLKATVTSERTEGRPVMPAFEVPRDARIVKSLNAAYQAVRGEPQPTGALAPPCYYSTDAGHFDRELGMKGIVCGPGGRYNTVFDERVDIADYLDMIRIHILTMFDIREPA